MNKDVSVIIPTLNEENNIENCIRSLVDQIEKPLEIIIVDNGSIDKTKSIVNRLKRKLKKDINIKLFCYPHGNQSDARQLGVKKSKGKIIGSLDADACPDRDWVNKINKYFKDSKIIGIGGKSRFRNKSKIFNFFYVLIYYFRLLFNIYCLGGGNSAYRKSSFLAVKGYRGLKKLRKERKILFVKDDFFLSKKLEQKGKLLFCPDLNVSLLYRVRNNEKISKNHSSIKEVFRRVFLELVYDLRIISYVKDNPC